MPAKAVETKFRPNELKQYVLAALGISVILGGSILFTPNFPIILGSIIKLIEEFRKEKVPERKVRRILYELEKRELISIERINDELLVTVKEKNNIQVLKYSLRELLKRKKNMRWVGKWFLTVFDVPEKERIKRNYLRRFLREIGFYPYQQSVYVFPFECKKEVELIKKIVESGKYISYIVADKLEREDELKRHFNIA